MGMSSQNKSSHVRATLWLLLLLCSTTPPSEGFLRPRSSLSGFSKRPLCTSNKDVCPNSVRVLTQLLTALSCARNCNSDPQCIGFSRRANAHAASQDTCTLHYDCLSKISSCHAYSSTQAYYEKYLPCANRGYFDRLANKCRCTASNGWVGKLCSAPPDTCRDLQDAEYSPGTHLVTRREVPSLDPPELVCYLNADGTLMMTVYHNMNTTSPMFNRTWHEIENGFKQENVYWIGLKYLYLAVHSLSPNSPQMNILFTPASFKTIRFNLRNVTMSDASTNYQFTFHGLHKTASQYSNDEQSRIPDCFSELLLYNDTAFSSPDRDNDKVTSQNCAQESGFGFWYATSCRPACNPFGVYWDSTQPPPAFVVGPTVDDTTLWAGQFRFIEFELS